jgi:hypothetical protein
VKATAASGPSWPPCGVRNSPLGSSQTRMACPAKPYASGGFFGGNTTPAKRHSGASQTPRRLPVAVSHITVVPSWVAATSVLPSGEKVMDAPTPRSPATVRSALPAASQNVIVACPWATAICLPSDETATPAIGRPVASPTSRVSSLPVVVSQSCTV